MKKWLLGFVAIALLFTSCTTRTVGGEAVSAQCVTHKLVVIKTEEQIQKIKNHQYCYYQIPDGYAENSGSMPDSLQKYTQTICEERGISYPLVLAVIERESGYRNIDGDEDRSAGYMQIMEKWHRDRMKRLGVTDLKVPEQNILVGIDYLMELSGKYQELNLVLMAYNMGESGAEKLWNQGIYSSEYSEYIIRREEEISIEIYRR